MTKGIKQLYGYPLIDQTARNDIKNNYQKKTDENLQTTDKTIVGGINEVVAQYKTIEKSKPMNILFLGGKNDGSEDIGAIINKYTDAYSIYLPNGIYKVSTPIILKNSLIGAGYSRNRYSSNNNQTWLLSEIAEGSLITINNSITSNNLSISNLSILLKGNENGIEIITDEKRPLLSIEKVGIFDVSGTGVNIKPTVGTSRLIMIDTLVIFGKAYANNSIGIDTNNNCYDCRFNGIEIMGTKHGMIIASAMYANNVHLWTGSMSGHDKDDWWKGTRGIIIQGGADGRFSNLYLDTHHVSIAVRDNSNIHISNLYYWEDTSIAESTVYDGSLFWTDDKCTRKNNIVVSNGIVYIGNRLSYITNPHTVSTNLSFISNKLLTTDTQTAFPFTDDTIKYKRSYSYSDSNEHYVPIACLMKTGGSYSCKLFIAMGGGNDIELFIYKLHTDKIENFKIILNNDLFHEFYYKFDNDLIYIYTKVVTLQEFSIIAQIGRNIKILDIDALMTTERGLYLINGEQNNTDGLTLIERNN